MEQLIQNPGRPSQGATEAVAGNGSGGNSTKNKSGNIFAGKVRKATNQSANNNQHQPRFHNKDNQEDDNMVSSGGEDDDDEEEGGDEYGDESETRSQKERNRREEENFDRVCRTLLGEANWNGLAIESKRVLEKNNNSSSWLAFFYYGIAMYK